MLKGLTLQELAAKIDANKADKRDMIADTRTTVMSPDGATDQEAKGILQSLIEGADLSAWGMLNAVTAQAHTATNYDRSVELETAGGALLDLAPNQWREILEAA